MVEICTVFAGEKQERRNTEEDDHQQEEKLRSKGDRTQRNQQQLVYGMRALELYNRVRMLDAQRDSSTRSLLLAAFGAFVLVGGAAASTAEKRVTSQMAIAVAVFGGIAEICGLVGFVKSV